MTVYRCPFCKEAAYEVPSIAECQTDEEYEKALQEKDAHFERHLCEEMVERGF